MDNIILFKGSSLISSKLVTDLSPLPCVCLHIWHRLHHCQPASSTMSGILRSGLVHTMPTVTICTSITSPPLLSWIKPLPDVGMLVNMVSSPLPSCCCSLPREPRNVCSMWPLCGRAIASCCCSSVLREDCACPLQNLCLSPNCNPPELPLSLHCPLWPAVSCPTQQCAPILIAAPLPPGRDTILLQAATLRRGRDYQIFFCYVKHKYASSRPRVFTQLPQAMNVNN